jgi:hypothetical protein
MSSGNLSVGRISSGPMTYRNEFVQVMKCSRGGRISPGTFCPLCLSFKPSNLILHNNKFICSRIVIYGQTDGQGETNRRIFCNFCLTNETSWLNVMTRKCEMFSNELYQDDCRNTSCTGAAVTVLVALWDSSSPYSVTTCETRILNSCMH